MIAARWLSPTTRGNKPDAADFEFIAILMEELSEPARKVVSRALERNARYEMLLDRFGKAVLVQREMESGRSMLVSEYITISTA
jgi:hypothetical protein